MTPPITAARFSSQASATGSARIVGLESLRGLMALWVVLTHVLTASGIDTASWHGPLKLLGRGVDAVDVFVIMSGFVIWMLLDSANEGYLHFIVRRVFRLYPLYLVCLLASIPMMSLAVTALRALPWDAAHNADRLQIFADTAAHLPSHLAAHLTMLHGAVPDSWQPSAAYAILGQAWSISLEWQFYVLAPLLFALCLRRAGFAALALFALALHFLPFAPGSLMGQQSFLLPKLYLFVIGMASYLAWKHQDALPAAAINWLLPVGVLAAGVTRSLPLVIWAACFLAILAVHRGARGPLESIVARLLSLPAMRFIGEISYSLYLSHMVILYLLLYTLMPYAQSLGQAGHLASMLVGVPVLAVALSAVLHRWVELPGIAIGKRLAASLPSAQPGPSGGAILNTSVKESA